MPPRPQEGQGLISPCPHLPRQGRDQCSHGPRKDRDQYPSFHQAGQGSMPLWLEAGKGSVSPSPRKDRDQYSHSPMLPGRAGISVPESQDGQGSVPPWPQEAQGSIFPLPWVSVSPCPRAGQGGDGLEVPSLLHPHSPRGPPQVAVGSPLRVPRAGQVPREGHSGAAAGATGAEEMLEL